METLIRYNWRQTECAEVFKQPFSDLLYQAQTIHRQFFDPNAIQVSQLLSIKTGACPEDCAYCSQSARYKTGLQREKLMPIDDVVLAAKQAKANGATRFCLGAAWRSPKEKDFVQVLEMVRAVKRLGLETCITVGMISQSQADRLKDACLDYYNHNLDTSPAYYKKIITTRTYQDRLDTLEAVRASEIKVCCGGIIGMGETREDRLELLIQLANLPTHPESVPINLLMRVPGTPLADAAPLGPFEIVRTIATARIMMPKAFVRLSAGREMMSDKTQALCFVAGANSLFTGKQLLTTPNPEQADDKQLLTQLGLKTRNEKQCKSY